jgi:hypothetical protein
VGSHGNLQERKQNLIIVAGADYGQGSSRDWAAKGVRLAGVEAIAAEGFERIHRTNLIGMGVMPLEFKPGTNRLTLGLDGTETYDVEGDLKPRADLTLVITRKNGEVVKVPMTCRLDTAEEVSVYEAGGVLQRFSHRTFWPQIRQLDHGLRKTFTANQDPRHLHPWRHQQGRVLSPGKICLPRARCPARRVTSCSCASSAAPTRMPRTSTAWAAPPRPRPSA